MFTMIKLPAFGLMRWSLILVLLVLGTLTSFGILSGRMLTAGPSSNGMLDRLVPGIIEGDVAQVRRLLDGHHADINSDDSMGVTPLHHAVMASEHQGTEVLRLLLHHGAAREPR